MFARKYILLLGLFFLVGCSGQQTQGQAFWQSLVDHLLEVVFIILTPTLLVLAKKLYEFLAAKTSIQLSEQQQNMLNEWISKGIAFAHEQERKALKAGEKALSGDEKKIAAVEFISEALKNTGLVDLGKDQLAKFVEAQLHIERKQAENSN